MLSQGLHHTLDQGFSWPLQLTKKHPRHAWVLRDKANVCHEDGFKSSNWRLHAFCGLIHSGEQAFRDPRHHRLQDGFFIREMTKNRTLSQAHVLGNGGGGDVAWVLLGRQSNHCLYSDSASFISSKILARLSHNLRLQKKVIYYYLLLKSTCYKR